MSSLHKSYIASVLQVIIITTALFTFSTYAQKVNTDYLYKAHLKAAEDHFRVEMNKISQQLKREVSRGVDDYLRKYSQINPGQQNRYYHYRLTAAGRTKDLYFTDMDEFRELIHQMRKSDEIIQRAKSNFCGRVPSELRGKFSREFDNLTRNITFNPHYYKLSEPDRESDSDPDNDNNITLNSDGMGNTSVKLSDVTENYKLYQRPSTLELVVPMNSTAQNHESTLANSGRLEQLAEELERRDLMQQKQNEVMEAAKNFKDLFGFDYTSDPKRFNQLVQDYETYYRNGLCAELVYHDAAQKTNEDAHNHEMDVMQTLRDMGIVSVGSESDNATFQRLATMVRTDNQSNDGFKVDAFYDTQRGKWIIAFSGTDFSQTEDFDANIAGAFSMNETENKAALNFSEKAINVIAQEIAHSNNDAANWENYIGRAKESIEFTGHSLGGRLASICAITQGVKATVYNPANIPLDLHRRLYEEPELSSNAEKYITNLTSEKDELAMGFDLLAKAVNAAANSPATDVIAATVGTNLEITVAKRTVDVAAGVGGVLRANGKLSDQDKNKPHSIYDGDTRTDKSKFRIGLEVLANIDKYGITREALKDERLFKPVGRKIENTPGKGGHSITDFNQDIAKVHSAIQTLNEYGIYGE